MRFARTLMLVVVSGAIVACYKPTIGDRLRCADAGAHACPEGFVCERTSGFCRRTLTDGGVDNRETGPDGMEGGQPEVPPICFDAGMPGCESSDAGICDPFCQTGCDGCRTKCSVNTLQAFTCNDVPQVPISGLMQFCSQFSTDLPGQTDNCAPGYVCIDACFPRCFQFCRQDSDCTNAGCSREVIDGGQKVCDVPFVDGCVPLGGNRNTGCGADLTMACYLSSSHPNRTICDCPFNAVGPNGDCTRSRDCLPGLACVDRGPQQPGICLQVCRLGTDDCGTGNPASCRAYPGRPVRTVMHATFGYCF